MNFFHETPKDVVSILRKHIPNKSRNILEPAVGEGSLLQPFLKNTYSHVESITIIDIDRERLNSAKKILRNSDLVFKSYCDDFTHWALRTRKKFDCIVMNPPFHNIKGRGVFFKHKILPVEMAFLEAALELLEPKGRLIAILPASIISGDIAASFRKRLLASYNVRKVYELPNYAFHKIEGRFYILIVDNRKPCKSVVFEKNFDQETISITSPLSDIAERRFRLDFSYHLYSIELKNILKSKLIEHRMLSECCSITRGKTKSESQKLEIITPSDFIFGLWDHGYSRAYISKPEDQLLKNGDILLTRVGRNCHTTFGTFNSYKRCSYSDCILRIRPNRREDSLRFLLSLRVLYASEMGKHLMASGTGASYVTESRLKDLPIITNIDKLFPKEFSKYRQLHSNGDFNGVCSIENYIRNKLG